MNTASRVLLAALKYRRALVGEISLATQLPEDVVVKAIEEYSDVVRLSGAEVVVLNPVELALRLIARGVEPTRVSEYLDWRDFEELSSKILYEFGYDVVHPLALSSPVRFEIDVFGVEPSTGFSIAIDCKHWSTSSPSRLVKAADDHYQRLQKMFKFYGYVKTRYRVAGKARLVVPVITTLLTPSIRAHNNVLFLAIKELPRFLAEKHAVLDYYEIKPLKIPQ
jgi:hypothetical protein